MQCEYWEQERGRILIREEKDWGNVIHQNRPRKEKVSERKHSQCREGGRRNGERSAERNIYSSWRKESNSDQLRISFKECLFNDFKTYQTGLKKQNNMKGGFLTKHHNHKKAQINSSIVKVSIHCILTCFGWLSDFINSETSPDKLKMVQDSLLKRQQWPEDILRSCCYWAVFSTPNMFVLPPTCRENCQLIRAWTFDFLSLTSFGKEKAKTTTKINIHLLVYDQIV